MPACCLEQIDARARPLDLRADRRRHAEPRASDFPRYVTVSLTAPFCLINSSMMSLTGTSDWHDRAAAKSGTAKNIVPERAAIPPRW